MTKSTRKWPSRRACTAIFFLLLIGAAIQTFVPPLNRETRGRQLYEDAWCDCDFTWSTPSSTESVKILDAALNLYPENSTYQQALVWKYPKERLPQLLKERNLSSKARSLAYGLIFTPGLANVTPDKALSSAAELKRLDVGNSIACYFEAYSLGKCRRLDEAYADVRAGNRIGVGHLYEPEVSKAVRESLIYSKEEAHIDSHYITVLQAVARDLSFLANRKLQAGDVRGACDVLDECCRMGASVAAVEPRTEIKSCVAQSIFSIGYRPLSTICKDYGMRKELAPYSRMDKVFEDGRRALSRQAVGSFDNMGEGFVPLIVYYSLPQSLAGGLALSMLLMAIALVWWQVWAIAGRKGGVGLKTISPWSEGQMVRLFLAAYLPIVAVSSLLVAILHFDHRLAKLVVVSSGAAAFIPLGLVILGEIVVPCLLIRALRRAYMESMGEKVGVFRFIFLGPARRQAWSSRCATRALCAQFAFFICAALLLIIVYKPIFGIQPWQVGRIPCMMHEGERAISDRLVADLAKVAPAEWHVGK